MDVELPKPEPEVRIKKVEPMAPFILIDPNGEEAPTLLPKSWNSKRRREYARTKYGKGWKFIPKG